VYVARRVELTNAAPNIPDPRPQLLSPQAPFYQLIQMGRSSWGLSAREMELTAGTP
jgi:hypothetical protein